MCGRVNVSDNDGVRLLLESLGMKTWPTRDPRFNIAPTQTLDVVMLDAQLSLQPMSWGVSMLLPGKNGMVTRRVQNARDDKLWSSRLWKPLMESQRVLVPINGFYEWKRQDKKLVSAYYMTPAQASAMFLAGIYKRSTTEADKLEVSVVTISANDAMSMVHDRMPVLLLSANEAMAWLQEGDRQSLDALIKPASNDALTFTEVSNYVNKSTNEGAECIQPVSSEPEFQLTPK
ncbi:SOS response-associated peptidase [Granulosicoccus antarcticus]|uniref:Abasic site processing protein n=1 Tax=Granulosicoccus antarcticus IMCC3135 TaxID=1192854 RepID=A0A2Z2NG11_9GAMM|nr:SOS response-associated peptidase [Granulosicoccus antarcticus]ASJ70196.1 Putative SOS response-associated peptidase YedK [Granulosicoccus antarcticus IMCC3135]